MDKYLEYLESLRQSNPGLLSPENRGELMKLMGNEFKLNFKSETALVNFAKKRGFELPEKKKDVPNGDTELDSTLDQPKPSLESQPVQDGMGVVDLTAAQKRSNYISKRRETERSLIKDDLYSDITANFLDTSEEDVKISLTKKLVGKGFNVNEKEAGTNAVEIIAPNGNKLDVDLSYSISDRAGDFFDIDIMDTPLGAASDMVSTAAVQSQTGGANRSQKLLEQAKNIRGFLKENTMDVSFAFQDQFNSNKTKTTEKLFKDMFEVDKPYPVNDFLSNVNKEIQEARKKVEEARNSFNAENPMYPGERAPFNPELAKAKKEVERLENTRTSLLNKKNAFSRTVADLINNSDSLYNFSEKDMKRMVSMGLDVKDLKMYGIKIDGANASYNELSSILMDDKLREAVKEGKIDLQVNQTGKEAYLSDLMKDAVELEKVQMSGNYAKSIMKELGASTLEVIDNVTEAVMDVQGAVAAGAMKLANKYLMGDKYNPEDVDALFEGAYSAKSTFVKEAAKSIRQGQMQLEGDMLSAESFGEFMYKGGKAAAQSAPITATFLMAPQLGLALTGVSSYGSSIREMREIKDYIKETGDPTGMYTGYGNLTLQRARAISASKALTETAFTAAFTYSFLKGLGKSTEEIGKMSRNEGRKLINFYSKGFISNATKMGAQSVSREIPEEELIVVGNMFLDEVYGLADYSFKDYTKAMKNTALTVPFSSLPLTGVAYRKMDKTSKDFVNEMIANYVITEESQADINELNQLDYEIDQQGEKNVDKSILEERDALAKRINEEHDRKLNALKERATDAQIVEMSVIMNDINDKIKQYMKQDQPRMRKQIEDQIKKLNDRADAILEAIGVKEGMVKADLSAAPDLTSKADKKALQVSEKITEKLESENIDNEFFNNNRAKFEEMSKFLSETTTLDLTSEQKKLITEMYSTINKSQNWHIGFDKYYNNLIGGNKLAGEVLAGRPTSEKIKPMTRLESLFTGYKGGPDIFNMANINHILSFMFKNDRMGAPIKNLSGRIDANANKVKNDIDEQKAEFSKGVFLKGKVTKKRLKNLQSEASMAEMMILSELTKKRDDESAGQNFAKKKAILEQNKAQLKRYDDSESGRETQKIYAEAYDKLLGGSTSLADAYSKANPDVVEAVKYLSQMFESIKEPVFERMQSYYGREGTSFDNYIPSIISTMGSDISTDRNSDAETFVFGPNSMQETISYDNISETDRVFLYENWASMVFKSKENLEMELALRSDIDVMRGFLDSKTFENMFDTESKSFKTSKEGDFAFLRDALKQKLKSLDASIQTLNGAKPKTITAKDDLINTITKSVTAKRLSTISMRASQANSAMLAALPIVGFRARKMLIESLVKFNSGRLTDDIQSNKDFLEVIKKSSTSRRSGATQLLPEAFGDRPGSRKYTSITGKGLGLVAKGLQKTSDKTLDVMLGQSDKIAGQATWAAFYYDRMVQTRGSEIKGMNFEQFWAWSKNNTDMDAVAWADSQVDRSQMLSNEWNNGKAFKGKLLSNLLFPFGRFAYNRKVGMANDWSIINDDVTATEADKAKAKRRLISATIEIGVFKTIQPTVSILVTQAAAGFVSGLVGWDEEYDKAIEIFKKAVGNVNPLGDLPKKDKFSFSNYEMNVGKQFSTSLVEGMIPLPTPSAANEVLFAAINKAAGDEYFNVYSEEIRKYINEDTEAFSVEGLKNIIFDNAGLVTLAGEDAIDLSNAMFTEVGRMSSDFGGEDRWVIPEALPAAEFVKEYRKVNMFIQSADLKKLLDKTERLLKRKYTTTNRPDYEAYKAKKGDK